MVKSGSSGLLHFMFALLFIASKHKVANFAVGYMLHPFAAAVAAAAATSTKIFRFSPQHLMARRWSFGDSKSKIEINILDAFLVCRSTSGGGF